MPDPKKNALKLPSTKVAQEPIDSLKWSRDVVDKYKRMNLKADPKRGVPLDLSQATTYVRSKVDPHRPGLDSLYNVNKAKDPNYKGVSAKEADAITGGKGKSVIAHTKVERDYRGMANKTDDVRYTDTPIEKRKKPQPKFGGTGDYSEEELYVPDPMMSKAAKIKLALPTSKAIKPKVK